MREDIQVCNFTAGELSPRLKGRTDYAGYYNGAEALFNMVVMPQGGATRRPGTQLIALAANQGDGSPLPVRLIPFSFSSNPNQSYVLEIGAADINSTYSSAYIRFYKNDGLIANVQAVTGAANNGSGLIRLAVPSTTGLQTGNQMTVKSVGGTVEAIGTWPITVIDTTHVDLQGSAFVHAYTSGGSTSTIVELDFYGALLPPLAITGAASGTGGVVRLAVNATASVATGETVLVSGVQGTIEANGSWPITVIDSTHIELVGSTFANAYSAGAAVVQAFQPTTFPYLAQIAESDLRGLRWVQSADTLFLFGGGCAQGAYPVLSLQRLSDTNWTLNQTVFRDGPYLGLNTTATKLTASAASGAITITASNTYGINGNQGFLSSDVGRHVRLANASGNASGWAIITGLVSTTQVNAVVMSAVNNGALGAMPTAASAFWQLGKWGLALGYPKMGAFWQQRLVLLGTISQPNAVEGSVSADFTNFAPSIPAASTADVVSAVSALSWLITDNQVNDVRWVSPAGSAVAQQMGIGTSGKEQVMQPATTQQALSASNVQVYPETQIGSAPNVDALRIGKSVLFVNRPGRRIMDWQWAWVVNGYLAQERTAQCEHITRPQASIVPGIEPVDQALAQGIVSMVYQQSPYSVIWAILGDGQLIGFTFLPEQNVIFAGHRHQLGGQYYGGHPIIESIACIPSQDGSYDELWLSVLRTIGGTVTRTTEVMTRYFDAMPVEQAWFVDCGLQSAQTFAGGGSTILTPPTLPNVATNGQPPKFFGAGIYVATNGAPFAGTSADLGKVIRMNGGAAAITAFISTTQATATNLTAMNSLKPQRDNTELYTVTAQQATFSGLSVLNGETVQIQGDGFDFGTQTVSGGAVTLPNGGTTSLATIGLPYNYTVVGMPFEPQRAAASSHGKAKSIGYLYLRVLESTAFSYGLKRVDSMTNLVEDRLDAIELRAANDAPSQPPSLFTGIKRLENEGGYDFEGMIEIAGSGPYPCTVLGWGANADVGDMEA